MSRVFDRFANIICRLSRLTGGLSGVVMFFLIGIMIFGVLSRYLFRSPKAFSVELPVLLFSAVIAFCLAEAQRRGSHVRAEILLQRFGQRAQRFLTLSGYLLTIGYSGIVAWAVAARTTEFFEKNTATVSARLPLSPFGVVIVIGVSLLGLQALIQAVELLRAGEPNTRKNQRASH